MVALAFSATLNFLIASGHRTASLPRHSSRNPTRSTVVSALYAPYSHFSAAGLSGKASGSPLKLDEKDFLLTSTRSQKGNPPIMPAVMTPGGPLDLSTVLLRNRIIFIGQPVNSQVAERVISQLVTLATIDEDSDILVYLNCPGGSTYSVLAIYDCMSWIKPKVGTVCFGVAASQGALLLAGGEKGMRYAKCTYYDSPTAEWIWGHRNSGLSPIRSITYPCLSEINIISGHVEDVRRQVNEAVQSRHKIDEMYAAFTGQPLEKVQQYTKRDHFLSVSEKTTLYRQPGIQWLQISMMSF